MTSSREHDPTGATPGVVAYLSPEFALDQALPIYSGGLGVLAGDHLKTAGDLDLPLVGVGLLYRGGYFRQELDAVGTQVEHAAGFDPVAAGLELTDARIAIRLPGALLHARVWRARTGPVSLYLLDSDVPENAQAERDVTDVLYGGDNEHRLRQEILLGIGGVKALAALGIEPAVFHSNEGHAGFMGLERVRMLVEDHGQTRAAALAAVRAAAVFTTHTPVPAGIDRFPVRLIRRYFGRDGVPTGLPLTRLLALGADPAAPRVFDMAALGIRLADRVNGVSRLHGDVSRELFARYWAATAVEDVPIGHITNGVHPQTWVGAPMQRLLADALGERWATAPGPWSAVRAVAPATLWRARGEQRAAMLAAIAGRVAGGRTVSLDPEALTIGFARRVPTYKRLTMMLHERERLTALLNRSDRPVQLVVAGKAHPRDMDGKRLLAAFGAFAASPEVAGRVVLLSDYDMALGAALTQGADVWLNTPLRPHEACGTSGMKSALNGGLNLSILDGWWDELYDGDNGWAIPSADDALEPDARDAWEADALLTLLEDEVVPAFYDRAGGVPGRWLGRVSCSLESIGPRVLGARMLRDYVTDLYEPAAAAGRSHLPARPRA
jgi:starch phosphorylase